MLTVYTFVFGVVFNAKWGGQADSGHFDFAIILFSGLIIHSTFTEIINRAPNAIVSNSNFVKKVIFPLELLPIIPLISALISACISIGILAIALIASGHNVQLAALTAPLIFAPLIFISAGAAWILASLGVFIRDTSQLMGVTSTVLLFVSPVFFPLSAIPETLRPLALINPLSLIIEEFRNTFVFGSWPNFKALFFYFIFSLFVAWIGYTIFQRTRKGFSDVL